jgi:acyl carrier protein
MTRQEIVDKVIDLIQDNLSVERPQVEGDASFIDDLGADSLDIVELVVAIESEFGIDIPDDDAEKISTVNDAIHYVTDRIQA